MDWAIYLKWLKEEAVSRHLPSVPAPLPAAINRNSRTIKPGEFFLPIKGENFDGHAYIKDALSRGASGFFCDRANWSNLTGEEQKKGLQVNNALAAYQSIARGWRNEQKNLKLLALTGSTGKTTVRGMLTTILQKAGPCLEVQGNYNNEIGVPHSLCQLQDSDRYAPLEFGARKMGDIAFLTQLADPDIVALLNIGSAHLGIFGSSENLAQTKLEIFTSSRLDAICIANYDDPRVKAGAETRGKNIVGFGYDPAATIRILSSSIGTHGNMFIEFSLAGEELAIEMPSYHLHHPINAAAAIAMAYAAGTGKSAMQEGLQTFKGVKGRFYQHEIAGRIIIDDTYNANPESMLSGIKSLAEKFANREKIIILGDMLELGANSVAEHRRIGAMAASLFPADLLLTVGCASRATHTELLQSGHAPAKAEHFATASDLLAQMERFADQTDIFYLKGSNGIKLNKVVDYLVQKLESIENSGHSEV